MQPLSVSVVIPTHNRAALVTRAVASAVAAAREGDEIIVIDDGSTDGTESALAPYRSRIRYIPASHGGAGAARNHGIRESRNPLVAFLDSDDEWMADKLHLQAAVMQSRPNVLFCFSDMAHRSRTGQETRHYLAQWHKDPRPWDQILGPSIPFSTLGTLPAPRGDFPVHIGDLYLPTMERFYVSTITLMVRRQEAGEALRFAEDLKTYEDWQCIGFLTRAGRAAYLDCETCWNWSHAGPRLTDANQFIAAETALKVLERVWGSNPQFLKKHQDRYDAVCAKHHLKRASWFLRHGQLDEARTALQKSPQAPWTYRAVAALPKPILDTLLGIRSFLKPSAS